MAIVQFSDNTRNAILECIELVANGQTLSAGSGAGGAISGTAAPPLLRILTGSMPANCASAQTGTLLAQITLPADPFSSAAAGSKSLANGPWSTTASGTGTATYYRITDSTGTTCHEQGDVGMTGSGAALLMNNTNVAAGQAVLVTAKTMTAPNP